MIFSYNWLKQYIKGKMPGPEELVKLLMFHSFEIEGLEKKGQDYLIDIDVLPNRAHDCLCYVGVAREIAAICGLNIVNIEQEKLVLSQDKIKEIELKIQCPKLVPRYSAIVVKDVKISDSPKWMRERLETVGIRSINNIVDLTNFIMLETGQPLHAFDYDKIRGRKMIIRQSKKGEKVITLDDVERKLEDGMLVIEDGKGLIDLVGIMGGKLSEIDSKTKNIVLQAGNFDKRILYVTSKKLKHSTDASCIYTQGIDPNLTVPALERANFLLKQSGNGKIVQLIDIYPKKVMPKKIKLDLDYVNHLLGVKIPKQKAIKILKDLGFGVSGKSQQITVTVPTRRVDVLIPCNLVEEIGRVYGYENIPSVFPAGILSPPKRNDEFFWENNIRDILKEAGFCEAYGYSFVGDKDEDVFGWPKNELVEIANPVSSLNRYLRPSLIINLTKAAKENLKNFDTIRMFELGSVFRKKNGFKEKRMLTGVLTGKGVKDDGFYILKGAVDDLFNKLGISDIWYDNIKPTPEDSNLTIWHPGKTAEIKSGNTELGFLGQLHPAVAKGLNIKEKIFLFDIDLELTLKAVSEEHEYRPISPYPAVLRDISLLVPRGTKTVDILNAINIAGGAIVRDVDLFDVYSGKEVPDGRENFAFHIIYQSEEKTLSSQEVDMVHQKIIKLLEENLEWEVRK